MTLGIVLLGVMTYNPFKNEQISIVATFTMPKSNGNKDQTSFSLTVFFKMPTLRMKGSPMSISRQTCNNNYFFNNPSTKKGYELYICHDDFSFCGFGHFGIV